MVCESKFVIIALNADVAPGVGRIIGTVGTSIGPAFTIEAEPHWRQWLGSIRMDQLNACNLWIEAVAQPTSPLIPQLSDADLLRMAHYGFLGLLLAANFTTFDRPLRLSGTRGVAGATLQQVASLPALVHEPANRSFELIQSSLSEASGLSDRLWELSTRSAWRINRSLTLYRNARDEPDPLERIHQYVRCLEGPTKPEVGRTTGSFVRRMAVLAGHEGIAIFKQLYDLRGAIEHLREDEILMDDSRQNRLKLFQDEHYAEYLARSIMVRIVSSPTLWDHFGNRDAVDAFWKKPVGEQQELWGDPIDPRRALENFDASLVSDQDLGI